MDFKSNIFIFIIIFITIIIYLSYYLIILYLFFLLLSPFFLIFLVTFNYLSHIHTLPLSLVPDFLVRVRVGAILLGIGDDVDIDSVDNE